MRSFDIKPTEDNIIKAINEDLIKRNGDLVLFYKLLCAQENSCSIAVDGRWGSGKTFFVKQEQLIINAKNPVSDMDEEKRNNILKKLVFKDEDEQIDNSALAVYYDAWEHDNDKDPVVSIVYEIIKQLSIKYSFSDTDRAIKVAASVVDFFTGRNLGEIKEALESNNPIAKFREEKDVEEQLKEFFSNILNERGNRLVIFIDELDRCRPSYAVQLLERIKHYLEDDRITFVFSVNLGELQHTVKRYYGDEFDACRYLDRFFDLRIELPPADTTLFYSRIGLDNSYVVERVCRKVIEFYGFQLRDTTRFYRTVRTAIYEPTHESKKWDFAFPDGQARQLILLYIIPVVIRLRIADMKEYHAFMSGKSPETLINIFGNSDIGHWAVENMLSSDESFIEMDNKRVVTKEEKLRELYNAIFVDEYTGNAYCKSIGKYQFDAKSKEFVKRVASMLSQFTDFTV